MKVESAVVSNIACDMVLQHERMTKRSTKKLKPRRTMTKRRRTRRRTRKPSLPMQRRPATVRIRI